MSTSPRSATLSARVAGVGFWTDGLPSWESARAFAIDGTLPAEAPTRPQPQLLAPNERRRAPPSVAVALEVGLAACTDAARDPQTLASVFASTHGDLAITDYMCATLVDDPAAISPTRFHNSVHNAAAGYWTIGNACTAATTAISAYDASFAQGLVEALSQLQAGDDAVLLVAYDSAAVGPAAPLWASTGLLGGALVLVRDSDATRTLPLLTATLAAGDAVRGDGARPEGALARHAQGNAMAPMLPLFDALATRAATTTLHAGPGRALHVALA